MNSNGKSSKLLNWLGVGAAALMAYVMSPSNASAQNKQSYIYPDSAKGEKIGAVISGDVMANSPFIEMHALDKGKTRKLKFFNEEGFEIKYDVLDSSKFHDVIRGRRKAMTNGDWAVFNAYNESTIHRINPKSDKADSAFANLLETILNTRDTLVTVAIDTSRWQYTDTVKTTLLHRGKEITSIVYVPVDTQTVTRNVTKTPLEMNVYSDTSIAKLVDAVHAMGYDKVLVPIMAYHEGGKVKKKNSKGKEYWDGPFDKESIPAVLLIYGVKPEIITNTKTDTIQKNVIRDFVERIKNSPVDVYLAAGAGTNMDREGNTDVLPMLGGGVSIDLGKLTEKDVDKTLISRTEVFCPDSVLSDSLIEIINSAYDTLKNYASVLPKGKLDGWFIVLEANYLLNNDKHTYPSQIANTVMKGKNELDISLAAKRAVNKYLKLGAGVGIQTESQYDKQEKPNVIIPGFEGGLTSDIVAEHPAALYAKPSVDWNLGNGFAVSASAKIPFAGGRSTSYNVGLTKHLFGKSQKPYHNKNGLRK